MRNNLFVRKINYDFSVLIKYSSLMGNNTLI